MNCKLTVIIPVFILLVFQWKAQAQFCNPIDSFVVIQDNESTSIQIIVDGVQNNDLSHPDQGLCGIQLSFIHSQVADLTFTLTSPAGQEVMLVGPYLVNFPTPFTQWNVSFTQCGLPTAPDAGFPSTWNNEAAWAAFGTYSGTYHPYEGCLEDFNSGTVNGTWTFNITDNILFDAGQISSINLLFCDPPGIDCDLCEADAGIIQFQDTSFCIGDPALDMQQPDIEFDNLPDFEIYDYQFIRILNDTIENIISPFDLSSLDTGTYKICGLAYNLNDSLNWEGIIPGLPFNDLILNLEDPNSTFCADLTENCIEITLLPSGELIDTTFYICAGDTISFGGEEFSQAGEYFIVDETNGPCGSTTRLHILNYDVSSTISSDGFILNCDKNTIELTGEIETPYDDVGFFWATEGGTFLGNLDSTTVTVSQPGIYYFITDKDACLDTSSVTIISDGSIPEYLLAGGTITCSNPEIILNLIPLDPVSQIKWITPIGDELFVEDPVVSIPGEYMLELTGMDGCIALGSVEVMIDTIPPSVILGADTLSCKEPSTRINFSSTDNILEVFWPDLGTNIEEPVVDEPGIYYIEATGYNGCVTFDSIEVTGNYDFPILDIVLGTITCYQDSVFIDLTATGEGLTFHWVDPDGNEFFTEDIETATDGPHQVSVRNDADCITDSTIVVQSDLGSPVFSVPDTLVIPCDVDSVQLIPNIISQYDSLIWYGPGSSIFTVESPFVSVSGIYVLEITGKNGCIGFDTSVVAAPPEIPEVEFLIDTINCINIEGQIEALFTGDLSFDWIDEANNSFSGSIVNSPIPQEYSVTITDNTFNCTIEQFVSIPIDTVPPLINISVPDTINCLHPEVDISMETVSSIASVHWTGPGTDVFSNQITVDSAGEYFVEVVGSNGCETKDSVDVFQNDHFIPEPDTFYLDCVADSILIFIDSIPVDSYSWFDGTELISTSESVIVYEAGDYKIVVSTEEGCKDSTVVSVNYDQLLPEFSLHVEGEFNCIDSMAVIEAELISDIIDYGWSGPSFSGSSLIDTIYQTGTYVFYALGTNLCEKTDSITIVENKIFPEINAMGDSINCNSPSDILTIEAEVLSDYMSLSWNGPQFFYSTSPNNVVQDTGLYILTVEGSKGCYSYDTAHVLIDTFPPEFRFIRPDTITCLKTEVSLDFQAYDNIISNNWTGNNGFNSDEKMVEVTNPGIYWLQVVGENGCINTGTVEVPQNKLIPYISLDAPDISCNRVKVPITLETSSTYYFASWTGPNGFLYTGPDPAVKDTGIYYAIITDLINGCQNIDSIYIQSDLTPPELLTNDYYSNCNGDPVYLEVGTDPVDVSYSWSGPNGFLAYEASPGALDPGIYYVSIIRNDNGCIASDSLELFETNILPALDFSFQHINCESDSSILNFNYIQDISGILWSGPAGFESNDFNTVVYTEGDYTVEVTGENGCVADSSFTIELDTISPVFTIQYDDFLLCDKTTARLSTEIIDTNGNYSYDWQTIDGIILSGFNGPGPLIEGAGLYSLTLTDQSNRCKSAKDIQVEIQESPLDSVKLRLIPPSCSGYGDGSIEVIQVISGAEPFLYSLDNSFAGYGQIFTDKSAGQYLLTVTDDYGCSLDTLINLPDGPILTLNLTANPSIINLGESSLLEATIQNDQVIHLIEWEPAELISDQTSLQNIVSPDKTTSFSIKIEDVNGCELQDYTTVYVVEKPEIYIPNIFTPNNDDINDKFTIQTGSGVEKVLSIDIYDRWGNKVFRVENPDVDNQFSGWDGTYNGNRVIQGVYVYHIEIMTTNGKELHYSGDLTVIY